MTSADATLHAAEMARRRERLATYSQTTGPVPEAGTHRLCTVFRALIPGRGRVFTSAQLQPLLDVSNDVRLIFDVIRQTCVYFGNLIEQPAYSELEFSLNFTPRPGESVPTITANVMSPLEVKLVLWNSPDGSWNVRHNVIGATAAKVHTGDCLPGQSPLAIADCGCLPPEGGREARSIQLD